ncbi:MAG: hypothetical protein MR436_02960 [Eubacterium sp.]|nr:hypothetical protein [Eubacterium sp.]
MFTEQFLQEIQQAFDRQMTHLGERQQEICRVLETCTEQEAWGLKCLYTSMPVSDSADYPPELFLSYAKHGVYLWEKGPFAGKIPEKLFAGYVLHHRVNNENITDHRGFFYEQLKDRIQGKSMLDAILEVNYWCASQATYRTTDGRTASASSVYRSAYGRCGEESTFLVSVLRSVGIPARQVYVPLWSHCDDNHAWVEAWCDGEWKFLGACEPEEVLNKGWFTNASSRAMMVHSRWLLPVEPEDDIVGKKGMSQVLNQLGRYAHTAVLEVSVVDRENHPAAGVKVNFEVLNYSMFGNVAIVPADAEGKVRLVTGLGSIHVTASKDGAYGEALVDVRETRQCTIVLGELQEQENVWEDLTVYAPKDAPINRCVQSEEEIQLGREKFAAVTAQRLEKEKNFFDEKLAEQAVEGLTDSDRERCVEIMKQSKGNQAEIAAFLTTDTEKKWPESWKMAILNSLREKDYVDITAELLKENCLEAAEYPGTYPEEILVPYVLCPRVDNEMIISFRPFIRSYFSEEEKEEIRKNPEIAWTLVNDQVKEDGSLQYENLITSARGALTSGYGSLLTKRVVSVQILRTLGVPSRLNPADQMLEVWNGEQFVTLEKREDKSAERTSAVIIEKDEKITWTYFQNWTIARFEEGGYQTLQLCDESGEEITGEIALFPGTYRILTANRLPNGNIFAKKLVFTLGDGEKRSIHLEQMEAQLSDMMEDNDITDFALKKENGTVCRMSELVREKKGLFIWLEESQEPTEHILNEIYQRREAFANLQANLYFVIRDTGVKRNPTLQRTLSGVTNVQFLLDDFGADMSAVARRMYLEPGKLPLIVIVDETMTGIYGVAGYNVGTADMILKLLQYSNRND